MVDPLVSPKSDRFVLGHELIDVAHSELNDLAAEIEDLINGAHDRATIASRLSDFHLRLADHCAHEEELLDLLPMNVYASTIESHRRAHDILIGKVWEVAYRATVAEFDLLAQQGFGKAVLELLRHQLVDDTALVGALIREGLQCLPTSMSTAETEA